MPGVFAAGDVRSGANRRVAAAVGEGSAAIFSVQQYLPSVQPDRLRLNTASGDGTPILL